uniref:Tetratricopeptide repeat protein 38 n=2 Tax=Eptatretus burgeri TaxID=7764 RepID=A0A8C4N3N5_EPTBU
MSLFPLQDAKAWASRGIPLNCPSDTACKMFDASVQQYLGWFNDGTLGGLEGTLRRMLEADPCFVMGKVLSLGTSLLGTGVSPETNDGVKFELQELCKLEGNLGDKTRDLSTWEKQHINAIHLLSEGRFDAASCEWEDILNFYPRDPVALRFAHDAHFYLGQSQKMCDSIAGVLPEWPAEDPLSGYLKGIYAFGLVETNHFDEAEKQAKKALVLNPKDGWATHALAHVYEMRAQMNEGLMFMEDTESNWKTCDMLAAHNYWHWSLYFMDEGDYDKVLNIYDKEIEPRFTHSGAMLDIVDACSLLYRLEISGVDVSNRWLQLAKVCSSHYGDRLLVFNDLHLLMAALGAHDKGAQELISGMEEAGRSSADQAPFYSSPGVPLAHAMVAQACGRHEEVAATLSKLHAGFGVVGGSGPQVGVIGLFFVLPMFCLGDYEMGMIISFEGFHYNFPNSIKQKC